MTVIKENMNWPPVDLIQFKMQEHSAWFSGVPEILANFYSDYSEASVNTALGLNHGLNRSGNFWGRQIKNDSEIYLHVPIAGDIATTSASFLFSESPIIRIAQADEVNNASYKNTQRDLDNMLLDMNFHTRLAEAAEACSPLGGIFIKIAWDEDLSPYPIPVVVQADRAIPEFKFGILTAVTFWKNIEFDKDGNKVFRLLERYEKGSISYELYEGTADKLGFKRDLKTHPDTEDLQEVIETVDELLAVYIPNKLPNKLDRSSYSGYSDLLGIESLMDSLDQTFSSWMKDIILSQAKVLLPESYLKKVDGKTGFNVDKMLYVQLDMDPVSANGGNTITPQQFDIRAEQFEKTILNLLDRIITSAGYSPQSFGLNIQGRAESGTALSMRERKSFMTTNKKQQYWDVAIKRLVKLIMLVYNEELDGKLELDSNINVTFGDSISNNLTELSTSVKMLSDAQAASTDTKVRLLHPDWTEEQILAEVQAILKENSVGAPNPDNLDFSQLNFMKGKEDDLGMDDDE